NMTGNNKVAVYKSIASVVIHEVFAVNKDVASKRTGSKWERYTQAGKLHQTSEGVCNKDNISAEMNLQFLEFYIPPEGPSAGTSSHAKNLWETIVAEFPYFSQLHRLLSSRPNIMPIVITTGAGPNSMRL
ncbi:hypothetical protein CPB83DRAFT_778620, partial [Crepidotus variabilis]